MLIIRKNAIRVKNNYRWQATTVLYVAFKNRTIFLVYNTKSGLNGLKSLPIIMFASVFDTESCIPIDKRKWF